MVTLGEQRLFQIEFQVGAIQWEPPIEESMVCASFQFLDFPPVEVCSTEFCSEDLAFQSGKMLLFSLTHQILVQLHNKFIIHIRVFKLTLKAGRLPFRTELASAELNIDNDFSSILSTCFQPQALYPTSKFIHDEIDLTRSGESVGVINTFIRLSSLGPSYMGRMYKNEDESIVIETDSDAQALVVNSQVKPCRTKCLQTTEQRGIRREFAACAEDNNVLAVRLNKPVTHNTTKHYNPTSVPVSLEPDTVVMKGKDIRYEPDPDFVKPENPSTAYYSMVTHRNTVNQSQVCQLIQPATARPITGIGPITGMPPDDTVDVFVLRIGKKQRGFKLEHGLEVEVRTPKYVSRNLVRPSKTVQYNQSDLAPPQPAPGK